MATYKKIEGFDNVYLAVPKKFGDDRGYFRENYNRAEFKENTGIDFKPQQINESASVAMVVRGLHFRKGYEAKLVRCVEGSILDVIVDIRKNSPSYGMVFAAVLSKENQRELFVPKGFAHGFIALSKEGVNKIEYLVDKNYNKDEDRGYFFDGRLCDYLYERVTNGEDIFPAFDWNWNSQEENENYIRSEKDKQAKKFHPKITGIK